MASIEKDIVVNAPLRTVYNQWTQFEEFPKFMEGVKSVRQLGEKRLQWSAEVMGKHLDWTAEIVQQIPDQRITWKSTSGAPNGGSVAFSAQNPNETKIVLRMEYEPEGVAETAGSALGFVNARVAGDLNRFKKFIEERGSATGEWRGEIHGQQVRSPGEAAN